MVAKKCSTILVNSSSNMKKKVLIFQQVNVGGQSLRALIDTGSGASILGSEIASLDGWIPKGPTQNRAGADSSPIATFVIVEQDLTMELGNTIETVKSAKFVVVVAAT